MSICAEKHKYVKKKLRDKKKVSIAPNDILGCNTLLYVNCTDRFLKTYILYMILLSIYIYFRTYESVFMRWVL